VRPEAFGRHVNHHEMFHLPLPGIARCSFLLTIAMYPTTVKKDLTLK
jgi:hypothetical protein